MNTALFDFDGTLFSTNQANYKAYAKALSLIDIKLTKKYYNQYCDGQSYKIFLPKIVPKNQHNQIRFVHDKKKEFYKQFIDDIKPNIMLFNMIKSLRNGKWQTAIVTTASKKTVIQVLKHYKYETLFDLIIAGEDVIKHKPDPEAYILAMQKLHSSPADTIIFEDSTPGIKAAKATGSSILIIDHL